MSETSYAKRFDLRGKTAVVTGGAGILGRHFCAGLAEHGASVAVADRDADAARELAESLTRRFGRRAIGVGCDVSDEASVRAMAESVERELGRVDILHNNAASKSEDLRAFFAPFEEYSLAEWRKVMSVNIDGMFLVAREIGGRMVRQGRGGSIVQTASIYGVAAPDQRIYKGSSYLGGEINTPAVYAASKAAVVGLSKYLATYWADKGVRVNSLTPGGCLSGQNETFVAKYSNRVPMGRMAFPEEMVGALVFLASDASSYVTGQNVIVDGGLCAW